MRRVAFPVMDATRVSVTHMTQVSQDVLPRVCAVLHAHATRTGRGALDWRVPSSSSSVCTRQLTPQLSSHAHDEGVLHCLLHMGSSVTVPLTVLGAVAAPSRTCSAATSLFRHTTTSSSLCSDDAHTHIALHSPGLAGAFVVTLHELATCRGHFTSPTAPPPPASTPQPDTVESCELGSVCLLEALHATLRGTAAAAAAARTAASAAHTGVLERLYRVGRRRHYGVRGMERMMTRCAQLHRRALQLRFPYHCGGVHAAKRYFDARQAVCDIALDNDNISNSKDSNISSSSSSSSACCHTPAVRLGHGVKVLSGFGTAVVVGVSVDKSSSDAEGESSDSSSSGSRRHGGRAPRRAARHAASSHTSGNNSGGTATDDGDDDDDASLPCVYWHASGAAAACVSPLLHGCRLLAVGAVPLEYNGPTRDCTLLQRDDVRLYMNVGDGSDGDGYDTTRWLCEGLYGVVPGDVWRSNDNSSNHDGNHASVQRIVAGVAYNSVAREFDLLLRDTVTGALELADEL